MNSLWLTLLELRRKCDSMETEYKRTKQELEEKNTRLRRVEEELSMLKHICGGLKHKMDALYNHCKGEEKLPSHPSMSLLNELEYQGEKMEVEDVQVCVFIEFADLDPEECRQCS